MAGSKPRMQRTFTCLWCGEEFTTTTQHAWNIRNGQLKANCSRTCGQFMRSWERRGWSVSGVADLARKAGM